VPDLDPRAFRWVEAGVSGLARSRDWDAVELISVPELADRGVEELRFGVLADGAIVGGDAAGVPQHILDRFAERLAVTVEAPYEAVAARQTRLEWSVAARQLRIEEIDLPHVDAAEIVVAVAPDDQTSVLVDGSEPDHVASEVEAAAAKLEELGRSRHRSFVIRARRTVGDRWAVSVDPL
jgi:hypothetical protein